jgi:hypothetical protein
MSAAHGDQRFHRNEPRERQNEPGRSGFSAWFWQCAGAEVVEKREGIDHVAHGYQIVCPGRVSSLGTSGCLWWWRQRCSQVHRRRERRVRVPHGPAGCADMHVGRHVRGVRVGAGWCGRRNSGPRYQMCRRRERSVCVSHRPARCAGLHIGGNIWHLRVRCPWSWRCSGDTAGRCIGPSGHTARRAVRRSSLDRHSSRGQDQRGLGVERPWS